MATGKSHSKPMATQSVDWGKVKKSKFFSQAQQFIIHPFMLSDLKDDTHDETKIALKKLEVLLDIQTEPLEPLEPLKPVERAPRPRAAFDFPPAPEWRYRILYRMKMGNGDWTGWMWFRRKPAKEFYKRRANAVAALGRCETHGYKEYCVDEYWVDEWGNSQSRTIPIEGALRWSRNI